MKKNYFFAMLLAFAMVSMNAQFTDDMESYTDGTPISGAHWTDWGCGGGVGCAIMSSSAQNHTSGGSLSGLVPDDTTTDAVLDMGNKIFGEWGLSFWMYIPSGRAGYWNIQGTVPIGGGEWAVGNIYFYEPVGGSAGAGYVDYSTSTDTEWDNFTYPEDQWFEIVFNVDISTGISNSTWQFYVDGVDVTGGFKDFKSVDANGVYVSPTSLGGIDFFSIDANNYCYYDDFNYTNSFQTPSGGDVADLEAKGFSAYPNPVNDVLNLRADEAMTSVTIHNLLGQEVYKAAINAIQSSVDMSGFAKGAYFVTVNIAGTEGTVKVIK